MTTQEKKKARSHLNNRLIELKAIINKNLYLKQLFVTRFHVSIQDYDSADYTETREMLEAEPETSVDDVSGGLGQI